MQKKIIALAVAGLIAAPMASQAAVEVYGKARMSVAVTGNDDQTATNDDSKLAVTSHASRVGFKGSDDLGGMTAVWQIETEVDMDNDSGFGDSMRNTFVGLAGDSGTVLLGIHDTPYKMATAKLDIFSDTHGDFNAIVGTTHDIRADNVIAYVSPDMSGMTLAVAYVTDADSDDLPVPQDGFEAFSLAGMYSAGPLYASLAVQSIDNLSPFGTNESLDGTKVGVGYNFGATDVGFIYESDDFGGSNNDQDSFYLSVTQDMGGDLTLKAAVGQKDDVGSTTDTGASFFVIGATKALSASTEVYALYASIDSDRWADSDPSTAGQQGYGLGSGDIGAAGTPEANANALSVGINMSFSSM